MYLCPIQAYTPSHTAPSVTKNPFQNIKFPANVYFIISGNSSFKENSHLMIGFVILSGTKDFC